MRFQLDHDWQGNMATPRARVGENAKTHLLLILSAVWILLGLTGHAPWKPLEATGISVVKNILTHYNWVAPLATGSTSLETPPLYYITAAISAKLLSPVFSIHDGARLINALWMSILLLMVGMTGRELWQRGVGRYATFIMIGTIGLVLNAHSLNHEIANLASCATGFYAFALSKRRPWRASALLALAISVGFLSSGILPPLILTTTGLLLAIGFKPWRTKSYATFLMVAFLIASLPIGLWLILFYLKAPLLLQEWVNSLFQIELRNHLYFLRILIWYAWPALPLALWSLWRYRAHLFSKPKFQLSLVFLTVSFLLLGLLAPSKDISALPLLLPLVALGAGSVEHLKRGAASALNWFGVSLFGLAGFLIWLGWFAMVTGYPSKIQTRMQFLSGTSQAEINYLALIFAIIITSVWILTCVRAKQSNRASVTNWAVGMTFGWGLLMTLWLPWIDHAKSYQPVFLDMQKALPVSHSKACINSRDLGQSQQLLLDYAINTAPIPFEATGTLTCDFYLIQDERGRSKLLPGDEWVLIWKGKRAADRKESFRLYQRRSTV